MAARFMRSRTVAIALIVQDDDGTLYIMGSKNVTGAKIEETVDDFNFFSAQRSFRIEAECADLTWQYRAQAVETPAIAQRGIYLPDMSFRALPDGGDK